MKVPEPRPLHRFRRPEEAPEGDGLTPRERELQRRLAEAEALLAAIYRSKMWRAWMLSITVRRKVTAPLRTAVRTAVAVGSSTVRGGRRGGERLLDLLRRLRHGATFLVMRTAAALVRSGSEAGAWLWLLTGSGVRGAAALLRRRLRPAPRLSPDTAPPAASARRPRLLIVSPYPIYPANHGGAVRLFNLIRLLARDCDLFLLIFIRERDDPAQRQALAPYCREVRFHRWQPCFERRPGSLAPPSATLFSSALAAARIRDLVRTHGIDVVQLEYTELAQYRSAADGAKVILVEHDLAFRSFARRRQLGFVERFPDSKPFGATFGDWMRLQRYEVTACRVVDQVHVMSRDDGAYLASFLPDADRRLRVVPNAVDVESYRREDGEAPRRGVLFVGNFENLPNVDALEYFLAEVWPRLRRERPDEELVVVGAKMSAAIRALGGRDGVRIVGEVPDMRPYYHGHRVLAAPIRAGSGTRLKLFEAFAAGIPVVSTTLGAEGIDYEAGTHLLIADEPEPFVAALLRLLTDDGLYRDVARAARSLVAERYDWSRSAEVNRRGVLELFAAGASQRRPLAPAVEAAEDGAAPLFHRGRDGGGVAVSIVIPTWNGGEMLERCLSAIARQEIDRSFEVILVDSGSRPADVARMRRFPVRLHTIHQADFNHGLTRDLGAGLARGEVLVFLNQDAVPGDEQWLARLTAPFVAAEPPAAVQGGILEFPPGAAPVRRFFWDSCGERFYFTRESERWMRSYHGVGFSTVNAAIRRDVWQQIPFGWAPIMEDKKWQREAIAADHRIVTVAEAAVFHTHDYDLRSLKRRCESEGVGWRLLGEPYRLGDMLRDMCQPHVYRELWRGVVRRRVRKPAELFFPWLRPWMLYLGNRWSRGVKL